MVFQILALPLFIGCAYLTFTDTSAKIFQKYNLLEKYYPASLFFFGIPTSVVRQEILDEKNSPEVILVLKKCLKQRKLRLVFFLLIIISFIINGFLIR